MKVVFMGTPDFSVPTLQALVDAGYEVAGVFTQPDRPKGRGGKVQMSPVKELALRLGIPVFQPLKIRADGLEPLRALAPDVCVTVSIDDGARIAEKTWNSRIGVPVPQRVTASGVIPNLASFSRITCSVQLPFTPSTGLRSISFLTASQLPSFRHLVR